MNIRTANSKDMDNIINVINTTFSSVRDYDFDIRRVQPKVYNTNKDLSSIHTIIEEDNKIVSIAGNYKSAINIAGKSYPFTILGSVSTLPEYQGKGYFKKLVTQVLSDTQNNGYIFTMLTGLRHRYNYFGFEKCGYRYYFEIDRNFCKYQKSKEGLSLVEFSQDMLEDIYNIYLAKKPIIAREKDDFVATLSTSNSKIYVYKLNNQIIGYTTFDFIKKRVNEFVAQKELIPYCVKLIFEHFEEKSITIVVSPFDKDTMEVLDTFAEDKKTTEQIHFKVYDMVKFLQMMFEVNKTIKTYPNYNQVFKINNQNIEINIVDNMVNVSTTNKAPTKEYTASQFLRYAFGLNSLYDSDKIFPLFLDFTYADLF